MNAQQMEEEKRQYEEQLDLVATSLKDDPGNAELLELKRELEQMVQLMEDSLAELKPKAAAKPLPAKTAPTPPPVEEKWSRENHPAFKKAFQEKEQAEQREQAEQQQQQPAAPERYQVNDSVVAKWASGDKGFYPARITSVTGSSTAPIYTVKFKSYDTVETLRAKDIRPMAQKRKADGSSAVASSGTSTPGTVGAPAPSAGGGFIKIGSAVPAPTNNGIVLSAAAEKYPNAQPSALDAGAEENPKKKFKKIKATKELEAGKSKWQEFSTKGKFGKTVKKDSMFRTPEGVTGRVGFTGSGQAMRKDPTRSRHIYQQNEELD